ncbi:MAG TPA: hypothetical protein VFS52_07275 [Steroidobacteraceae bacterium]|nr:hypothetical protein [Steroidobacteraceae bacterium]
MRAVAIGGLSAALVCTLCGCVSVNPFGKDDSEERAEQLARVQLRSMQFADEYVAQIVGPLNSLQSTTTDPNVRLDAQNWKLTQATAAYTNASESNPVEGALDLIVLASLSRMVIADELARPAGRLRSSQLLDAHKKLEQRAWDLSATVLDDDQKSQMQEAIRQWRAANPDVRAVALVHFGNLPQDVLPADKKGFMSKGLLGLIGIEPLRGLDPAVQEIAQTRQLAQRSMYYAQRVPGLLDMQVERLTYQLVLMPESQRVLGDVNRFADAADRAGRLAEVLPTLVSQEREEAIKQIALELNAQQAKTRALARELQAMLDAGTRTSDSINQTVGSIDGLVARFKPKTATAPATGAKKSSALVEYAQAVSETERATEQLQKLIVTLDERTGGVERLVNTTAANVTTIVDQIIARLIVLAAAVALIIVGSALAYRVLVKRIADARDRAS